MPLFDYMKLAKHNNNNNNNHSNKKQTKVYQLNTYRCDNAERSLKAPSGTTEISLPCKDLKEKRNTIISTHKKSSGLLGKFHLLSAVFSFSLFFSSSSSVFPTVCGCMFLVNSNWQLIFHLTFFASWVFIRNINTVIILKLKNKS